MCCEAGAGRGGLGRHTRWNRGRPNEGLGTDASCLPPRVPESSCLRKLMLAKHEDDIGGVGRDGGTHGSGQRGTLPRLLRVVI